MSIDNRQTPRLPDFARARINELCQLPCFLEDVSKTGCRVRFSQNIDIDCEREYNLTVLPALRSGLKQFDIIVRPQWVKNSPDSTEIGFIVLCSPGIRTFNQYVQTLAVLEEAELQEA
jgi:hypothetical protein